MYAAIDPNQRVSDVVAAATNAEDLFEEEGIDYWFGWNDSLREACKQARVSPEEIVFRLMARDRAAKDRSKESLVSLLSELDQHYELRLGPALAAARAAAAKLDAAPRSRCLSTLDTIDRVIQGHEETARQSLSPVAAALDVGAATSIDEKVLRGLAMEHSILALRATDLRDEAAHAESAEYASAARQLIREVHEHIKISYNFIMPRLIAAVHRPAGVEPW